MKFNITSVYIVISRSKIDVNQLQIVIIAAEVFSKEVVNDRGFCSRKLEFSTTSAFFSCGGSKPVNFHFPACFLNISSTFINTLRYSQQFPIIVNRMGITSNWCVRGWVNMSEKTMWCHVQQCCVMCVQTDVLWCHAGVSATLCGDFIVQEIQESRCRAVMFNEISVDVLLLSMMFRCRDVDFVIKRSMWWDDSMSWCLDVIE